jgi:hypothetical protein
LEGTTSAASEVSTKNRVVTLRASSSGRRGYRSQDLSTSSQNSTLDSSAADDSAHPSHPSDITDISDPIPPLDLESDTQSGSGAKSKPKQKNTTTVGYFSWNRHFQVPYDDLDKT